MSMPCIAQQQALQQWDLGPTSTGIIPAGVWPHILWDNSNWLDGPLD